MRIEDEGKTNRVKVEETRPKGNAKQEKASDRRQASQLVFGELLRGCPVCFQVRLCGCGSGDAIRGGWDVFCGKGGASFIDWILG